MIVYNQDSEDSVPKDEILDLKTIDYPCLAVHFTTLRNFYTQ